LIFAVIVLIPIVYLEIKKTFHFDLYHLNLTDIYRSCQEKTPDKHIHIYTNITSDEIRRIQYYSLADSIIFLDNIDSDDVPQISEIIPNFMFDENSFYFLLETHKDQMFIPAKTDNLGDLIRSEFSYTSKKMNKTMVLYQFSPSSKENRKDPLYIQGNNSEVFSKDQLTIRNAQISSSDNDSFSLTGKNTFTTSNDLFPVSSSNNLRLTATVKNNGDARTRVFLGYIFYDIDQNQIGSEMYPFKDTDRILTVLNINQNKTILSVDSLPAWKEKCTVAIHAKEDLSDIPNNTLLNGEIVDVQQMNDGTVQIKMNKPIQLPDYKNTTIRINNPRGAYAYTNIKVLEPGESFTFASCIAKYDTYHRYSSHAISKGVYYVKPLLLSYSLADEYNTILVSDFSLNY